MRKIFLALMACLAVSSVQAATSPLVESLLEYAAIIDFIGNPNETAIPQTEFITDVERITRKVDVLGKVKYKIVTRVPEEQHAHVSKGCGDGGHHTHTYIAELLVENNPGIGPNIITVISITQVHHKPKDHFENPTSK